MTTAEPQQHARRGRVSAAWHGFRRWRRVRPFWGGLLTALAGLEIFGTTQMSMSGLSFQLGPTGFLSWLIPTILVACGLLMWFSPQQRVFYAVVATVTALFSLVGVNLGGFFVGLLLGMVGSALGFAWTPDERAAARPTPDPSSRDGDAPGQRGPRLLAVLAPLLGLAATAAIGLPDPAPVRAAAPAGAVVPGTVPVPAAADPGRPAVTAVPSTGCPTRTPAEPDATKPAGPGGDGTAAAGPGAPGTAPTSPGASSGGDGDSAGNVIVDFFARLGRLFGGGDRDGSQAGSTDPGAQTGVVTPGPGLAPTPGAGLAPTPGAGLTRPAACATASRRPAAPVEEGRRLPRIAADLGQPVVAATPGKLTGSKVTMTGLRFEGIVDLPTATGTLRALKFSMDRAVTDDFLLRAGGPTGRTLRFATDRLTVRGDVAFYATRFVGRLLGIKITLTPDLPFPGGIPVTSPIPITFTDPVIDLAFVTSDTLTARPALRLDLV